MPPRLRWLILLPLMSFNHVARDEPPAAEERQKPAEAGEVVRADLYGDPLPEGAVSRIGTVRFCHGNSICAVAHSPDGRTIAAGDDSGTIRMWDAKTGKELWS